MYEEKDEQKVPKARQSRVLANTKLTGREKIAAAVIGNQFMRFGPETQDQVAALYLAAIRQPHLREEVIAALGSVGVKIPAVSSDQQRSVGE